MSYTCANCKLYTCCDKEKNMEHVPKNCPMRNEEYLAEVYPEYMKPEINRFYVATKTSRQPNTATSFVPRLRYVIDLCKKMEYKKVGLAFCVKFRDEADLYSKIIRRHGLEVVSVSCCNGGFNIADYGVPLPADCGDFDAACNPIGQARLMNEEGVEFNLVMGLCAGHDSLFIKHANAMSTVVAVKDPATGHCPPMALYLYDQYYSRFFRPENDRTAE